MNFRSRLQPALAALVAAVLSVAVVGTSSGADADDGGGVEDPPAVEAPPGDDAGGDDSLPPPTEPPDVTPTTTPPVSTDSPSTTKPPAVVATTTTTLVPVPPSTTTPPAVIATTTTTAPPADVDVQLSLLATVASAPRSPVATSGNARIKLSWLAPSSNGGASVDYYGLQRRKAGTTQWVNAGYPKGTSLVVSGLTNGAKYYFRVRAHNAAGFGAFSTTVSAVPRTVPSAPRTPVATPGNKSVKLSWLPPWSNGGAAVDRYAVQRYHAGIGWKNVAFPTTRSYVLGGLVNGAKYSFRVRAHNATGWGPYSVVVTAVPRTVPTAPRSPTAKPGNSSVTLSWIKPLSTGGVTVDTYEVWRYTGAGWKPIATTKALGHTVTTGLINGTKYSFRIRAHNAAGWGPYSTIVTATPHTVPSAPISVVATPGSGIVNLHWNAPSSDGGATIDEYLVQRSPDGQSWTDVGSAKGFDYDVTQLTNGTTYHFRVRAHNIAGYSPWSTVVSATTGAPTAPLSPSAIAGIATVELHWSAPSSAGAAMIDYYEVQQSMTGNSGWQTIATPSGVLTYPVGGLPHATYYFRILAHNTFGSSPASTIVTAAPITAATAPLSLTATPGDGTVMLAWQPPSSDGGALIDYYRIVISGPNGPVATSTTTNLSFPAFGLTNGIFYHFNVDAHNDAGFGASSIVHAEPFSVPSAPLALTAAHVGNGGVRLTWTPPSNDGGKPIDDYAVYKATNPAGPWEQTSPTGLPGYCDAYGLPLGTEHYFYVVAHNAAGWGAPSSIVSATPIGWPSAPACAAFQEGGAGSDKLRMDWSPPQNDGAAPIQFYRFEVWQNGVQLYSEDILPNVGTVSHQFPFGTYYPVQVTAKNAAGFGTPCIAYVVLYP